MDKHLTSNPKLSHTLKLIYYLLLVPLALLLGSCGSPTKAEVNPTESITLTVFAAASLTEAFTEIGHNFEVTRPEVNIIFNFAGSQQLAQQLNQGAPADVFASANATQMQIAIEAERVINGTQQTFTYNRLVVIYRADNSAELTGLQSLSQPNLHLILAAPDVPVGRYSQQFLDKASQAPAFGASFKDETLDNVVSYEQNVKAVLTKVALGEGDAGLVYTSDVTTELADQVGLIDIPDNVNTPASYPIAVVNDTPHAEQAQAFVAYVMSPIGQEVLAKFGFERVR